MRNKLTIVLSFFAFCLFCQSDEIKTAWNKKAVDELHYDHANSMLYFLSEDSLTYSVGQKIKRSDVELKNHTLSDLEIDANTLVFKGQKLILPHTITKVLKSKEGSFYIGTENGLYYSEFPFDLVAKRFYRLDIPDLTKVESVLEVNKHYIFSDTSTLLIWNRLIDDIIILENKLGIIKDAFLDEFGLLWLASKKGLYNLNLLKMKNEEAPILDVSIVRNSKSQLNNTITIDSNEVVAFQVKGRHPVFEEDVEIYYHLERASKYESGRINNELFVLKDLKSGVYKLRFSSNLIGKNQSNYSDYFAIEVNSKKSNQLWWSLFAALGVLILLWIIAFTRERTITKDILGQRDKLFLENKALKFEQDALRLQMNPHFIFNVLNSINGMIAIGDTKNARKYINDFSQLMRTVLNQSRTDYIDLENEISYLKKYLSLERVTRNNSFEYFIQIDPDLNREIEILPMIIQPFLENAIIHGFKKMERAARLDIKFAQLEECIEVVVQDNGVGRKKSAKDTSHRSVGLQVVRERLGNDFGFSFEDLKNEHGTPIGTKVNIKMPYK